ncbi:MAG TPA: hypothetical protein PK425_10410 [Syntrophales bacterium]|jgi:hypothetical protein|nr:hypothetical protein [Syntrophales bacterium]HPX56937.1 hypothetical protein [Syntrophales bacterium]
MSTELIETIELPNGLILEIWDYSRSIAIDTDKVELYIRTVIALDPSFFADERHYETTRKHMGESIPFEYRNERTFVAKAQREDVFRQFVDTFKKDTLPYLSKPDFPRRFALSRYRDIVNNPFKYRERP